MRFFKERVGFNPEIAKGKVMQSDFMFTPDELDQVCADIRLGSSEAVGKIVLAYNPFLLKMTHKWMRTYKLDPDTHKRDVHSLFVLTALKVAPKFDSRKSGFATYLRYPLQSAVAEYVGGSCRVVYTPSKVTQEQLRLRATIAHLNRQNLPVTFDSVIDNCHVSEDSVIEFLRTGSVGYSSLSLDAPMTANGSTLQEVIMSDDPSQLDLLVTNNMITFVQQAVASLSAREANILYLRHLDAQSSTLDTIAQAYGLSKARVGQIEKRALEKIKIYLGRVRVNSVYDLVNS